MTDEKLLTGKVAIVTGGAGAIGRALSLAMAAEGCGVVVCDIGTSLAGSGIDGGAAEKVVSEIRAAGGDAISSTLPISDQRNAQAIVEEARRAFGRVDVLVNNAGILRDAMFHKMTVADFADVVDVHLNGSFQMSRAVAPVFRQQGSGSAIHMTSTSALIGQIGQANYCAAKMGIVGLSRSIALDMRRFGVRSNCISPFAWSRMTDGLPANTERERERIARFRQMGPETIAPLAVYLASDRSQDVTGQIFAVRGNEIFAMSQPRPVRSVHRSQGWTAQAIEDVALPSLRQWLTPLEVSAEVFSWDPI